MDQKDLFEILDAIIKNAEVIDLSYALESGMPAWPTQARYGSVIYDSYDYGGAALHSQITLSEHTGTHIDAPKHFIPGGIPIDEIPLKALMGRGVKIDVTETEPSSLVSLKTIKDFEEEKGDIKKGDIVMFRFGWDKKYKLQPEAGDYLKDWPGLSTEAAEYLGGKKICAAGCDTLAIDAFGSQGNPVHHILLSRGILIIENLRNLSMLPTYTYIISMPLKIKGGSGSPLRLAAITENPEKVPSK